MPATMRVPTIFTAVDRITPSLRSMGRNVSIFSNRLQSGISTGNKWFNKLIPSIGEAGKQLLNFVSAGAIASAFFSGAAFSAKSIMEYEDAVASFRTIVSDLNDSDFKPFEKAIADVAIKTKKSTIDVAKSFENIAGLNADFAKTSDGLAEVSEAAITLAKASRMELGPAAENLVGIMNQFGLEAKDSQRAINVLAAGQAVGASNIAQSAEAYKNFGTVAKGANMTLEESQAIIQTLGKFTILGAEAGTKARGVTLQLQKAGLGYKSGVFKQVDALNMLNKKLGTLKNAKQKDALITKIFGAENVTAGKILLGNMELTKRYEEGVTGTSEAALGAAINTNTLSSKIDELKSTWINYLTTGDQTNENLNKTKDAVSWVTANLGEIVKWTAKSIGAILAFRAALLVGTAAIFLYNIGVGFAAVNSATMAVSVGGGTVAMHAQKVATYAVIAAQYIWTGVLAAVTAAQWLWNAAMTANPIGLIIVGIAALIGLVALIVYKWNEWGDTIIAFGGPIGIIIDFIMTLRKNWEMVTKAFKEGGIIGGLKAIGKVLLSVVLKPVSMLLGMLSKIPGMASLASIGMQKIDALQNSLGVEEYSASDDKLKSPQQTQQDVTNRSLIENRSSLDVNFNDQNKAIKDFKLTSPIPVNVTTTSGRR